MKKVSFRIKFRNKRLKLNKWYLKHQKDEIYCFFCGTFIKSPKLFYINYKKLRVFSETYYICEDCYKHMKDGD